MSVTPTPHAAHFALDPQATCTLWWIRTALGRTDYSDGRFVAYVQDLVDQCGFPPPFPSKPKGKDMTMRVTPKSIFRRDAVQAWIDDFLPPACAARLDADALRLAADDLDSRAAQLGRLTLIEGGRA